MLLLLPAFAALFAATGSATLFNSIPFNLSTNPTKSNFHVTADKLEKFQTALLASNVAVDDWYNRHQNIQFGTTRSWLAEAKEAWISFDWRDKENHINGFPNFNIPIDDNNLGLTNIHFIALFSQRKDALPLLFLHGWPGSVIEFLPVLDILASKYNADTLPYHVIVPSLPHYGLSGGPSDMELTLSDAARLMNELMRSLGFASGYVVQGGDIGSFIARILSEAYPECKAFHNVLFVAYFTQVNMLAPSSQDEILSNTNITATETEHVQRMYDFSANGSSYILEHGLRPSTVGLVLASSPLAALSWIGEKLIEWPDHRYPLSLDNILTLVTFYWHTDSFSRNLYPYRPMAEAAVGNKLFDVPTSKVKPFGYSVFPAENILMPEAWAKKAYPNLVYYKRNEKGGHFAALEQPEIFLSNVEDFLTLARPLIGI
ncbi:putative epoxide hydrolase [Colletotrichum gloeosporioides]|uniref:Putative epoxide hydrolase n=1 Tax=Colletotrichum gloeosporioides TaxID=474922 RepID=A0A8H4FDH4_COLGL|nr:putative epoxide hydrolase [Colletotrichum gloeosporioides]KAF3798378.1 putative epoxide hydrolase [Colletotrichum gloeosporioides]